MCEIKKKKKKKLSICKFVKILLIFIDCKLNLSKDEALLE